MKKWLYLLLLILSTVAHADQASQNFNALSTLSDLDIAPWEVHNNQSVITLLPTGGPDGSKAVKFTYVGELWNYVGFLPPFSTTEGVYTKFNVKFDTSGGGVKFLKLFGLGYDQTPQYYANTTWNLSPHSWGGTSHLTMMVWGDGGGLTNDAQVALYPNCEFLHATGYTATINTCTGEFYPTVGQWYTVETFNKQNTNSSADAEMWMKIDGTTIRRVTNFVNRNNSNQRGYYTIRFGDYSFPTANLAFTIDNVIISNAPISGGTDVTPPVTTATPGAGTYPDTQSVVLSCVDNVACASTVYCFTSGCTPSTAYTGAISTPVPSTLRYRSTDTNSNVEAIKQSIYNISAVGDVTPPTTPANLEGVATSTTEIQLTWAASEDNVEVAGYLIQMLPDHYTTSATNSKTWTYLIQPNAEYTFRVWSYDAADNYSAPTDYVVVVTGGIQATTKTSKFKAFKGALR